MLSGGAPPAEWTNNIASYIKSLAPKHLIADGSDGLVTYDGVLANTGVNVDPVDIVYACVFLAKGVLL
jgi:endo-1,4-beta-mannosidase